MAESPKSRVTRAICVHCGKIIFDDGSDSELIYRVETDEYLCSEECEKKELTASAGAVG